MVEGGAACMKYTLFFFNLLFFLLGGAVLGVGLWVHLDEPSFTEIFQQGMTEADVTTSVDVEGIVTTAPIVMIVCGAFIFVISFLGCCGAIKEWRPLLIGYALILLVLLIALVAAGIVAGVSRDKATDGLGAFLNETLSREYQGYDQPEKSDVTKLWDLMMVEFSCCGVNGYSTFRATAERWRNLTRTRPELKIPRTCCVLTNKEEVLKNKADPLLKDPGCQTAPSDTNAWSEGCKEKTVEFFENFAIIVMGVAIGIGLSLLLGIAMACCLCKAIGKQQMQV